MSVPLWAIAFALLTALLAAVGQLLIKIGAAGVSASVLSWVTNGYLILGLALHGIGFILLVFALKHSALSILNPVLASTYIWSSVLAIRYLHEPFSLPQWLGIGMIVGGIALIAR